MSRPTLSFPGSIIELDLRRRRLSGLPSSASRPAVWRSQRARRSANRRGVLRRFSTSPQAGDRDADDRQSRRRDRAAPPSFTFALTANIVARNVEDVDAVFDKSGSIADPIPGGATKTEAAVQAGQLLVQLVPPDFGNRAGVTRFSTTAANFELMQAATTAN